MLDEEKDFQGFKKHSEPIASWLVEREKKKEEPITDKGDVSMLYPFEKNSSVQKIFFLVQIQF